MKEYTCDLCGAGIQLKDKRGRNLEPVYIKVGAKYSWNKFHACEQCGDKVIEFLKSKPYNK